MADDGSTDAAARECNRAIASLSNCRYVERSQNSGRAAIRNFLAREAQFEWLLFLDCDMTIRDARFLSRYLEHDGALVIDGGVAIGGDAERLQNNLRYRYEKEAEAMHTADKRQQTPYRDFHTANFCIRKDVMLECPFDERFRQYGYEDVLMGKQLRRQQITIAHIDNPAGFDTFGPFKLVGGLQKGHPTEEELQGAIEFYKNL